MMGSASHSAPLFSRSQRCCHLLLLLYLPVPVLTLERLCLINGVEPSVAREDLADVGEEIQHIHQLQLHQRVDGGFSIDGTELNRRLCLLHWLRRCLRLSPDFVTEHFTPALRQQLKALNIETALHDEVNLQALVRHCATRLARQFSPRDHQLLLIFMQYGLCQRQAPLFSNAQRIWLEAKYERQAATDLVGHWQKRCHQPPETSEADFWTLLFSLIHAPHPDHHADHPATLRLLRGIQDLVADFQQIAGMRFEDEASVKCQLYIHLAQALDRGHFGIGIDGSLTQDINRLYPRLLRTTRQALALFEHHYAIRFSPQEVSLVTVIFGAGLMQGNALQEKQVLLLTGEESQREHQIEQQLREITLLPVNIRYQPLHDFQREGAPREIALVVSPYTMALPLYSPPLIHTEVTLSRHQQQHIRDLLES